MKNLYAVTIGFALIILLSDCGGKGEKSGETQSSAKSKAVVKALKSNSEVHDTWFIPGKIFGGAWMGASQSEVMNEGSVSFMLDVSNGNAIATAEVQLSETENILIYNFFKNGEVTDQSQIFRTESYDQANACFLALTADYEATFGSPEIQKSKSSEPGFGLHRWAAGGVLYELIIENYEAAFDEETGEIEQAQKWNVGISAHKVSR